MKRFDELTQAQQRAAEDRFLCRWLKAVCEGTIRFNDELNHDTLQARIDKAIERANQMQTPWFAHEYVLDTCREDLEGLARADAQDALYPSADETVMAGVAQ